MRSPHIIVRKWAVRSLNKGFVWQAYRLPCIKFITEQQFKERFGGRMAEMRAGYYRYLQDVSLYAYRRCQQLGLELDAVLQRLCEHPDPSKPLEVALWKARQAQFVWVVWIHVRGPVLEPYRREGFVPLEGLWPPHVRQINGIAELIDAPRLTLIEQGQLPSTDLYDVSESVSRAQRERYPKKANVAIVPLEYLLEDPGNAAIEWLSHPTGATNPFFRDLEKVTAAVRPEPPNPLDWATYELAKDWRATDRRPRYAHIDLAIHNDGLGITVCHEAGWKTVIGRNADGEFGEVQLPIVAWDLVGRLRPRAWMGEKELDYDAILRLLLEMERRGVNFAGGLVTLDRCQSHLFKTTLRHHGWPCELLSVDETTSRILVDYTKPDLVRKEALSRQPAAAMAAFRDACYQERAIIPALPEDRDQAGVNWLTKEASEAQADVHNARRLVKMVKATTTGASDDLLQALGGSCFNCVNNAHPPVEEHYNPQAQAQEERWYQEVGRPLGEDAIVAPVDTFGPHYGSREQDFYTQVDRARFLGW